ncbi:MAG: hypothetical protein SPI30_08345 [Prevotella sp.]|nr:hypothetical protein [Prevotella sp.]
MSSRLSVGFAESVAGYARKTDREAADKRTKGVGKQCLQRRMQPWRSNDRFGIIITAINQSYRGEGRMTMQTPPYAFIR